MKKIVVLDIAVSLGGGLSILKDFYNNVVKKDEKNQWIFILGNQHNEDFSKATLMYYPKIKKNRIKRLFFDRFSGKKIINKINPDLVISFQNTIVRGVRAKQILYVHQPIPFQEEKKFSFFKKGERKFAIYQKIIGKMIIKSIKRADRVIVQTKWMKQAIIKKTKISDIKISIIFPSVVIPEHLAEQKIEFNSFFYPTSDAIYKNTSCIIDAVYQLEKENINNFSVFLTAIKEDNNNKFVNYIGRISREEVFEKYRKKVLLFPSYIETFGLPMLEAKKCGDLIFASDCAFSHEILDGYPNAYFFNPFSSNELALLMKKSILNEITIIDWQEVDEKRDCNDWLELINKGDNDDEL